MKTHPVTGDAKASSYRHGFHGRSDGNPDAWTAGSIGSSHCLRESLRNGLGRAVELLERLGHVHGRVVLRPEPVSRGTGDK